MELAIQNKSNAKTVRSILVRDLKEFTTQSLATQVKKRRSNKFYDACY